MDGTRTGGSNYDATLRAFEQFYLNNTSILSEGVDAIAHILRSALDEIKEELAVHEVSGRVKTFESCVQKYNEKYRQKNEGEGPGRRIDEFLSDLIGIRIVCLYEDDIEKIADKVKQTFEVVGETNKIDAMSKNVDRFGYKALHYDLHLGAPRQALGEYRRFAGFAVELQIRTIFQDAWSVIDHQLKYKQKIHASLSRRINVFAALCELADQEFIRIRDDIRAAPAELISGGHGTVAEFGMLDLRGFLEVLRDNFPADAVLPDQADVLLATIRRLDPLVSKQMFSEMFDSWGTRLQEGYDAFRARRRKVLSPLTRTRLLLSVARPDKYDSLVTSADLRDLCEEIKGSS